MEEAERIVSATTLYVCDTQPIIIEGLHRVLQDASDFTIIGSSSNSAEAVKQIQVLQPQIVFLDQSYSGFKMGFRLLSEVRGAAPGCYPILWIYDLPEVECFRALQLGARGILKKSLPVTAILECLRAVSRGQVWMEHAVPKHSSDSNRKQPPRLTPREREIVQCLCRGLRNKQIANELSITAGTVKVHLMHIFEKAGVKDRFELAAQARRLLGTPTTVEGVAPSPAPTE
jgi:two-component system, NarL family, nitrate/nitrite response regulator NarL